MSLHYISIFQELKTASPGLPWNATGALGSCLIPGFNVRTAGREGGREGGWVRGGGVGEGGSSPKKSAKVILVFLSPAVIQ